MCRKFLIDAYAACLWGCSRIGLLGVLMCLNLIGCVFRGSLINSILVSGRRFLGNVTPTDYIRRWAYPGPNVIMVIAGDRQDVPRINDPNHLKHVMSLDTNGPGARTVKRTTSVQPVAGHVELRTVVPSEMLPHPPSTPLYGSLS
jgi:hypothetical protein